jgi:hypothetical protein
MTRATSTTATVIIMFLFLSDPSNIAIAVSLSEGLAGSGSLAKLLKIEAGLEEMERTLNEAILYRNMRPQLRLSVKRPSG